MAATFYQFPDGRILDLQNCLITRDPGNNIIVTQPTGTVIKFPTPNTTSAVNLLSQIYSFLSLSGPTFSSLQWSTDGSTWKNFPAPVGFITIYLQLNGTNLATGDGSGYSLQSDIPGQPVSFNTTAASSTQYTTGSQTFSVSTGVYDLYVYAITTGKLLLSAPGALSFHN